MTLRRKKSLVKKAQESFLEQAKILKGLYCQQ
jgi:hypothetical protein